MRCARKLLRRIGDSISMSLVGRLSLLAGAFAAGLAFAIILGEGDKAAAQMQGPSMLDANLAVKTVVV